MRALRGASILGRRLLLALALLAVPGAVHGQEMELSAAVQAELFAKVLTFDRSFDTRSGAPIEVVVVYQGRYRTSTTALAAITRALAEVRVGNRPFHVMTLDLDRVALDSVVTKAPPRLLYVTPLRGVDIATIAQLARETGIRTYTGVPEYVDRGLSVSVRVQADRPRLLINVAAARAEGARFTASLLQLAEISR